MTATTNKAATDTISKLLLIATLVALAWSQIEAMS